MPLSAVTFAGQPSVRLGSTTASAGRKKCDRHETFIPASVSVYTAAGETSEPVPAVVGTHATGISGPGTRFSPA